MARNTIVRPWEVISHSYTSLSVSWTGKAGFKYNISLDRTGGLFEANLESGLNYLWSVGGQPYPVDVTIDLGDIEPHGEED